MGAPRLRLSGESRQPSLQPSRASQAKHSCTAYLHSTLPGAEISLPIPSKKSSHTPAAFEEPQRQYTSLPPNYSWINFQKSTGLQGPVMEMPSFPLSSLLCRGVGEG